MQRNLNKFIIYFRTNDRQRNVETTTNENPIVAQGSATSPEHTTPCGRPSSSKPVTICTVTSCPKRKTPCTSAATAKTPTPIPTQDPPVPICIPPPKKQSKCGKLCKRCKDRCNRLCACKCCTWCSRKCGWLCQTKCCKAIWKYLPWLALLGLVLLWSLLYCLITIPIANYLPACSKSKDDCNDEVSQFNSSTFGNMFKSISDTPYRLAGYKNNDERTTQFIESSLQDIRLTMHHDVYELEVDKVISSKTCFVYLGDLNCSDGIMGVVALLQARSKNSKSWLLISSRYDVAVPRSHDAGSAAMVAVMIETLREITHSKDEIGCSIVFLFNGGTESPLHSAYSFVKQHKWGTGGQIKAFINLESIGSGGREVLFRSSDIWLTNIYCKEVIYPHANSFLDAMRIFKIIPETGTDFHILSKLQKIPGLELMYIDEGYTYRSQFDTYDRIPPGTLENTGRNLLALTRGIASSDKFGDVSESDGANYDVYYDFWHLFILHYSSTLAQLINYIVFLLTIILVATSLRRIWIVTQLKILHVLRTFATIYAFQLACTILVYFVAILTAIILDSWDNSMSWFSNRWLVFGLYVFPALLIQLTTVYLYFKILKPKTITDSYIVMMFLHAQSIIFALKCFILTLTGMPYAYIFMLALVFYLIPLALNLATRLHDTGYNWVILFLLFQIISFLYFTYLFHTTIRAIIPMMGRSEPEINPDLYIASLAAMGTILAMSFNTPLFHMYRKGIFLIIPLLVISIVCFILSFTSVGFPYRAGSSPGRLTMQSLRPYQEGMTETDLFLLHYFEDRRLQKELLREGFFIDPFHVDEHCAPYRRFQNPKCLLTIFNYRFNHDEHDICMKTLGKTTRKRFENVKAIVLKVTGGLALLVVEMTEHAAYVDVMTYIKYPDEVTRFWINDVEYPTKWAFFFHFAFGLNGKAIFQIEFKDHPDELAPFTVYIGHYSSFVESGEPELQDVMQTVNSLPTYVSVTLWEDYMFHYNPKRTN